MKKLLSIACGFLFSVNLLCATDLSLRIMPSYNVFMGSMLNNPFAGDLSLDFSPVTIRKRDELYISLQGSYLPLKAKGIEDLSLLDGSLGVGYNFRPIDRLALALEVTGGFWNVPKNDEMKINGASGISFGTRFTTYFNVAPELSVGAFAAYRDFGGGSASFLKDVELGLSLKYSFTKGLFSSSDVNTVSEVVQPIFPVFYSRYDDTNFGTVTFVNNEKNDIRDVEVFVFIEQYMTNPKSCAKFEKIKIGESFSADLTAFLNENILNNLVAEKADARVTVQYKSLGKRISYSYSLELQALSRNSMTWEDDRRAAAFVSPRDGSARFFATHVKSIVRPELRGSIPENIQYAAALFGALKAYGINYVIDPSSAFTDNIGTAQVDFLQFPYQTLLYHGGDCDDLTILNCALLEALGIDTALITVPGHIFMAFDAGVPASQASKAGDCVVIGDKVWVPLEITLCQDTFSLERSTAMREWRKYPKERALIPLAEAWNEYKPVGIPDSSAQIEIPSKNAILSGFRNAF